MNEPVSRLDQLRERLEHAADKGRGQVEVRRADSPVLDLMFTLKERDRDAFASVLGSAIALRLFLFVIPSLATIVGLVNLLGIPSIISEGLDASGTTGRVANDIQTATTQTQSAGLGLFLTGFFLMLWAGRSLTTVLAASAAGGWGLAARDSRPTLRMAATLSALVFALIFVTGVIGRLHKVGGIAVATGSIVASAAVLTGAWFLVLWTLPSATRDPGAQLPGAAFLGGSMALLQWGMQFYLPGRISRSSETFGEAGIAVAALGYFFFVGRIMASSFVVGAVVWERYGSLSDAVFALPGIRRLPGRFPVLVRFFGLDSEAASETPSTE